MSHPATQFRLRAGLRVRRRHAATRRKRLTALGVIGTFSTDDPRFYAAYDAREGHDADDRIIYDTYRGWLTTT
jgi:hypothetical protein